MKEVIEESEARSFYRWYYVSIDEKEDLFSIDLRVYTIEFQHQIDRAFTLIEKMVKSKNVS